MEHKLICIIFKGNGGKFTGKAPMQDGKLLDAVEQNLVITPQGSVTFSTLMGNMEYKEDEIVAKIELHPDTAPWHSYCQATSNIIPSNNIPKSKILDYN